MRTALAVRSDLKLEDQLTAPGATWLDRHLIGKGGPDLSDAGFGRDLREALDARAEHLAGEGLARRQAGRMVFARDLLDTLRQRELEVVGARLAGECGLEPRAAQVGEHVSGTYRTALTAADVGDLKPLLAFARS